MQTEPRLLQSLSIVQSLSRGSRLLKSTLALLLLLGGLVVGATPASADSPTGYRMQSQSSGKCLDVRHYGAYGAYANNCNGFANQAWNFANRQGEYVWIQSRAANACLSARDDGGVTVQPCNYGDSRQKWRDRYSDGTRHVFMSYHGGYLQRALYLEPDNNVGTRLLQRGFNINSEYAKVFLKVYPF